MSTTATSGSCSATAATSDTPSATAAQTSWSRSSRSRMSPSRSTAASSAMTTRTVRMLSQRRLHMVASPPAGGGTHGGTRADSPYSRRRDARPPPPRARRRGRRGRTGRQRGAEPMSVLRLLAFVLPLGLDSFAVAAALGTAAKLTLRDRLRISAVFVAFEGGMPLIGLAAGAPVARAVGGVAGYLAAAALAALGGWMLLRGGEKEEGRAAALAK